MLWRTSRLCRARRSASKPPNLGWPPLADATTGQTPREAPGPGGWATAVPVPVGDIWWVSTSGSLLFPPRLIPIRPRDVHPFCRRDVQSRN